MLSWRERLYSRQSNPQLPSYLTQVADLVSATLSPALTSDNVPPTSVLLYGPRGSGKSLVSQQALRVLSNEVKSLTHITLHGLLHNTPIRAWRHVAACLNCSHAGQQDDISTAAVEQCLGVISSSLQHLCDRKGAVVFLFEEFERFVTSSDGMSQTVLYSLFNLLQDARFRVACIVMTTSIDVTDGLEKRVKSRFTHRQIVLPLPTDASEVLPWIKGALLSNIESDPQRKRRRQQVTKSKRSRRLGLSTEYRRSLSDLGNLNQFFMRFTESNECVRLVNKKLARSRVMGPVLEAVDVSLASVLENCNVVLSEWNEKDIEDVLAKALSSFEQHLFPTDTTKEILFSLSALELAMLVALRKREAENSKCDDSKRKLAFHHVYSEYESMSNPGKGMVRGTRDGEPTLPRDVAEKAWERLVECGLVVRIGTGPRESRACHLSVESTTVDDVLQNHSLTSTAMRKWGKCT
ncbi:unnamed protein product [Agarophyton chilense]